MAKYLSRVILGAVAGVILFFGGFDFKQTVALVFLLLFIPSVEVYLEQKDKDNGEKD